MAESRYGRLFTEADVKRLLRYAAMRGEEVGCEALGHDPNGHRLDPGQRLLVEYEAEAEGPLALTFPADEPLFLLRGQDKSALYAFAGGYSTDLHRKHEASPEFIAAVNQAHMEMLVWQQANPDRVKVPT